MRRFYVVSFVVLVACGTSSPSGAPTPEAPEALAPDSGSTPDSDGPTADGGAPDAPSVDAGPACDRASGTRPAPLALFDGLRVELDALATAGRQARVDAFFAQLAGAGGTPLEDAAVDRVVFVAKGSGPYAVATSLAGFDPAQGHPMAAVAGTDLWVADVTIPRQTSFTYKLVTGSTFLEDPFAKNVVWDGIDRFGVGQFNAVGHAGVAPTSKGRIRALGKLAAPAPLSNERPVWAYLPPRYDDGSCAPLPSIVFHDGNESLTRGGGFMAAADSLYALRPELSAALVFVGLPTQGLRLAEYTFGDGSRGLAYVDFLASTLLPKVASELRLCGKQEARGISGASLGGLVSTFAALEKPTTWGWVGAQSPSFWWADNALVTRVAGSPKIPVRVYLDSGCPDDNCASTSAMRDAMVDKGYEVVRITEPNAPHDWSFWAKRLGGMLTHFREGQTACD